MKEDKKNKEVIIPQRLVGREIVQCPITNPQRSVVTLDFCKSKCNFFIKYVEGTEDKCSIIECGYPRRLEIISTYGSK